MQRASCIAGMALLCALSNTDLITNAEDVLATDAAPSYEHALKHMRLLECRLVPTEAGAEARVLKLTDKPVLSYTDPARRNSDGSVWAWPAKGRPLAMLELYRSSLGEQWMHAITLTSDSLVEVDAPESRRWRPGSQQVDWKPVPGGESVESRPAGRLRQLKALARRFAAHEFWDPDNSRYELRLLVSPLHRYDDEPAGIVDGAVFGIVHGTNPEILLLLEARKPGEGAEAPQWQYALARMGSAEMHVALDEAAVWTVPRTPGVIGKPTDPYWLFWTNDRVPAEDKKP